MNSEEVVRRTSEEFMISLKKKNIEHLSELELSKSSAEKVKKVESTAASHDSKQTEGSQSQKESSQDRKLQLR